MPSSRMAGQSNGETIGEIRNRSTHLRLQIHPALWQRHCSHVPQFVTAVSQHCCCVANKRSPPLMSNVKRELHIHARCGAACSALEHAAAAFGLPKSGIRRQRCERRGQGRHEKKARGEQGTWRCTAAGADGARLVACALN